MQCKMCTIPERPTDIVSSSLKNLKEKLGSSVLIPVSCHFLDFAACIFACDIDTIDSRGEYTLINQNQEDSFWNNPRARAILLRIRFDEHFYLHAQSCFKKGCECKFFFPSMAQTEDTQLFGDLNKKVTMCYTLDGERHERTGFVIELRWHQACQYMNTHSVPIQLF